MAVDGTDAVTNEHRRYGGSPESPALEEQLLFDGGQAPGGGTCCAWDMRSSATGLDQRWSV